MNNAIEVGSLYKSYGGVVPANNLSFTVETGELRCLIGPNGAGKSTLFKLIVGLEKAERGSVRLFGADVTREPAFRRIRRGVGVKMQSNRAYRNLDVAHNIRVADFRKESTARRGSTAQYGAGVSRNRAFSLFGIESVVKSNLLVSALSYAEQQWLEICCSIAPHVGLLLLDEPTAGMSVGETMHTAEVVKQLKREGLSVVVVEHDMAFVREVADKVTVLHQGELLAEGGMDDISSRPDVQDVYLGRGKK
jgi:branched-chain amino acid transport system ATP-binding protein